MAVVYVLAPVRSGKSAMLDLRSTGKPIAE
jgi:hypothetical protein